MSRRNLSTAVLLIATVFATTAAQSKSFNVRRAVGPKSQARNGVVLATVPHAPFNDQSNDLYDGVDCFYTVEDVDGSPVQISVDKDTVLGAVRLGFNDGDPQSADVDVANSEVVVNPPTIPTDSATVATIVVTPRDSAGTALGAGLTVTLDMNALLPGVLSDPVADNVNGTYTFRVVSSAAGQGTVVVTVEGYELADQPVLTYEFLALATAQMNLLQIMAELQAIIDADPGADEADELEHSVQQLLAAVAELSKTPSDRVGSIDKIKTAIEQIEKAAGDGFDATSADGYMGLLAGIARQLAANAIADAIAFGGHAQKIDEALVKLSDGDAHLALPDFVDAVSAYKEAARKAKDALVRSVDPIVHKIRDGLGEIESALDKGFDPAQADEYMDRLTGIARQLAVVTIDAAVAGRGAPNRIGEALEKLSDGDAQQLLPDYSEAVHKYEDATKNADDAAPGMTYDVVSLSGPKADLVQLIAELQAIIDADPGTEASAKLANSIQDLQGALAALP